MIATVMTSGEEPVFEMMSCIDADEDWISLVLNMGDRRPNVQQAASLLMTLQFCFPRLQQAGSLLYLNLSGLVVTGSLPGDA
jgi:hypothetical protein